MTDDHNILTNLDACRPDSDDLQAPEFSELANLIEQAPRLQRMQQQVESIDRQLTESIQAASAAEAVALEGLSDRILHRIQPPHLQTAPVETSAPPVSRRRWMTAVLSFTAIAAAVLLTITLWPEPPLILTAEGAASVAITYHVQHLPDRQQNHSLEHFKKSSTEDKSLNSYIPPKSIIGNQRTRWRRIENLIATDGIAWDLVSPDGGAVTATLYVIPKEVDQWPTAPTLQPQANTGGKTAWAWSQNGLVYLLVIDGQKHDSQNFVRPTGGPLT